MFFCTGCQNVQVIEPGHAPVAPVASTSAPSSPDPVPVCSVADDPDAGLDDQKDVIGSQGVVTAEHPPLPPSTPDSEVATEEEDNDTRMPVNRVVSTFDYSNYYSNYGQKFTVHNIPSSNVTIRAYEGLPEKYVTIDTTEPLTLRIASLRKVLNTIQPDPEKKRLEGSLLFMSACLVMSLMFHYKK